MAELIPKESLRSRVLDLGSGGGVPGLVLAWACPEAELVLLDSNQRRTEFLAETVSAQGRFSNVEVCRGRAEEAGRDGSLRGSFDTVLARGFGPPATTSECGAPFLRQGGLLIVSEPPPSAEPSRPRWDERVSILGLGLPETVVRGGFGFTRIPCEGLTSDRFPRRNGMPSKRPLF